MGYFIYLYTFLTGLLETAFRNYVNRISEIIHVSAFCNQHEIKANELMG